MVTPEQLQLACSELVFRWDTLVDQTSGLSQTQRQDFIQVAVDSRVVEKIALLREICLRPREVAQLVEDPARLISETETGLTILEEGVRLSKKLNIPIRNATLATAKTEEDRITEAERERIQAGFVQAIVPTVLSVAGAIVTSLIVAAVTGEAA